MVVKHRSKTVSPTAPAPFASASGQHVHLVADAEGDGYKEDGAESHPIVVAKLHERLEAKPDDQNKEQGHGRKKAVSIPIGTDLLLACTF